MLLVPVSLTCFKFIIIVFDFLMVLFICNLYVFIFLLDCLCLMIIRSLLITLMCKFGFIWLLAAEVGYFVTCDNGN